jgi:hypothetical protein
MTKAEKENLRKRYRQYNREGELARLREEVAKLRRQVEVLNAERDAARAYDEQCRRWG